MGSNMFSVSTNSTLKSQDISCKGGNPSSEVIESPIPLLCKGLACDSEGNIWIHNSNSGKLIKYNRLTLSPIIEFEGNSNIDISKQNYFYLYSKDYSYGIRFC